MECQFNNSLMICVYCMLLSAVPTQRPVLYRVLVCASAFLCLPIILGLARCLSSEVKPQPLPRVLSTHAAEYRDHPHPCPQPPPRCPVPQPRSTSSHRGASLCSFVADQLLYDSLCSLSWLLWSLCCLSSLHLIAPQQNQQPQQPQQRTEVGVGFTTGCPLQPSQ